MTVNIPFTDYCAPLSDCGIFLCFIIALILPGAILISCIILGLLSPLIIGAAGLILEIITLGKDQATQNRAERARQCRNL